ncbi:NFX1-type zinc finger-containing protein 1 [Holothuria leucospilota]|uniref:NFX1-type zinc finger-containing protein 1 n=1 Tax=Holothuria leucospilota TaxID=206669 RepID=A0A9Q1CAF6_HOLLE|nr:NFX1-type zinc finger-containing protein 1 [Holothuria leucospilota]
MASRFPTSGEGKSQHQENRRGKREDLRPTARRIGFDNRSGREKSTASNPFIKGGGNNSGRPRQMVSPQNSINCVALLKELQSAASIDVISRLYDARNVLGTFLGKKLGDERMQALLYPLSNACSCEELSWKTEEIVSLLHEKRFLEFNMTRWITEWKTQCPAYDVFNKNMASIILILRRMLHQIPDSASSIGATLLVLKTIVKEMDEDGHKMSSEISLSLKSLIDEHETFQRDSYELTSRKKSKEHCSPPEDFRCLPILPMPHELQEDFKPFLRSNIVKGNYNNVQHYLDVHFRLLKEDLIQPLREGISEFRNALAQLKGESQKMPCVQNFSVYENVIIEADADSQTEDEDGEAEGKVIEEDDDYFIHFDVEGKFESIDWELSKRLKNGSLLCLSPDNFQTLIFGIITERRTQMLEKGFIKATLSDMTPKLLQCPLIMVESPSYFEAYKHVLHRLQNFNEDTLPFQSYLVSIPTEGKLPKYVTENSQMTIDLTCIYENRNESEGTVSLPRIKDVNLCDDGDWPVNELLGFDNSQMEAYKAALREEVCIIQGPPGTGKTFIGLKIAKTLLANKNKWSRGEPLLVVCYTNHALDQFLEGILNFEDGVVRLGSRSSSEKVQERDLNLLMGTKTLGIIRRVTSPKRPKYKRPIPEIQRCEEIISESKYKILSLIALEQVLSVVHLQSLVHGCIQQNENCILFWLFHCDMYHTRYSKRNKAFGRKKHQDFHGKEKYNSSDNDKQVNLFIPKSEFKVNNIPSYLRISGEETLFQFTHNKMSQSVAMTQQEANRITDVWSLDVHQRWRIYMLWRNLFITRMQEKLEWWKKEYERREAISKENGMEEIRKEFCRFPVIGATTTGAAKNSALLQILAPPIVIVEEAAEILEAHVITALTSNCQHLILIGDHQQLRPSPEVYKLCKNHKLDVSLFERLINNGLPCHRLSTQHRMRPEISQLLKIHEDFYPGLMDHDMVTHYKDIRGLENNLYFIKHSYTEEHNDDNKSRSNRHEATFLYALYNYLLKQGYSSSQITILTAYRGQLRTFKDIMGGRFREVRVCPIDNFQGEENDIILFSLVRSNKEGNIGFLRISNRICVALSRAREGFFCIGNFDLLSTQNVVWSKIVGYLQTRQCIGTHLKLVCRNHPGTFTKVSTAEDFQNVPDGGCLEPCDARLDCGHTCPKKCHPKDKKHLEIFCKKPCEKVMCELQHLCPLKCGEKCGNVCNEIIEHICPNLHKRNDKCHVESCEVACEKMLRCGHQCRKKCSEPCTENCQEFVQKVLPCGHEQNIKCCVDPEKVKCPAKCDKKLSCGHICSQECCYPCSKGCREIVQKVLPCGHEQSALCFENLEKIICQAKCDKKLLCGHRCTEQCCNPCKTRCYKPVQKVLPCGHQQTCKCFVDPERVPCQTKCDKQLDCGHPCNRICSSPCADFCEEMVQKELPCGHAQLVECSVDRTKVICQSRCKIELPCGHACKMKCSQKCTTRCKEIVTKTLSCGHIKEGECYRKVTCNEMVSKTFHICGHVATVLCSTTSCPSPCSERLICGHICRGMCGECKNGALHVKCREPCEKRCIHSRCKNSCGDSCVPCARPCPWKCQHARCSLKCSEECNRDPCNRPCRKRLRCRHQCAGLCGEPCPPVCRVCNKTWIVWFLGRKDKLHLTRFIYLLDCQHVVEEKEMDDIMKKVSTDGDSMTFPECPWCMTPIRFNPRYQNKLRTIWRKMDSAKGQTEVYKSGTNTHSQRLPAARR